MQVKLFTNNFGASKAMMAHKYAQAPEAPQPQQPTQDPNFKSIYFGKKENGGHAMRNAAMGVLVPLALLPALASCDDKEAYATATANATANAYAYAYASANANVHTDGCYHGGCSCHCPKDTIYMPGDTVYLPGDTVYTPGDTIIQNGDTVYLPGDTVYLPGDTVYIPGDTVYRDRVDTLYKTKWDTCYIDTGSYKHDTIEVEKWKEHYDRPIPLDTLTKHAVILELDSADSVVNRNIIHYEYTREWEYNNRVIANINILESDMNKNVLVHDADVRDYKNNHLYYGKEVRRIPTNNVNLINKNGSKTSTKAGIFLEMYKNPADLQSCSIFESELQERYFLQTAGKKVKVYKYVGGNDYEEKGTIEKGYLGKNTILLRDLIGDYPTEDHLVDINIVGVNDDTLKEMYARARDEQNGTRTVLAATRSSIPNPTGQDDPNSIVDPLAAWKPEE